MAPTAKMHADQLEIPTSVVRRLVDEQFPAWRSLTVDPVPSQGTVNALFRLGDRLVARFPLRPADPDLTRDVLATEAAAAAELAGRTSVPTPEPVALGEPGAGYALPWSVQTWIPGTTAAEDDPSASVAFALDLARFVGEVRALPTRGRTFGGPGRGGDLRRHDAWMAECLSRSQDVPDLDLPRLRELWARLRTLPRTAPDTMTHGDLIPGNVLVGGGRLAGVLDVGGLGPADPALDLVGAWHLLDGGPREVLRASLAVDDLEWARGKAWAFEQAMGVAWYYVSSNPAMSEMGRRTLRELTADTSGP